MTGVEKRRLENAVAYFVDQYADEVGQWPCQTHLYKFLALFEFRILSATGCPPLGLEYVALKFGPVPKEIYDHPEQFRSDDYRFSLRPATRIYRDGTHEVEEVILREPFKEEDLDVFSDQEIETMNAVIELCLRNGGTVRPLIDETHKTIPAWEKAWERALRKGTMREPMSYLDTWGGSAFMAKTEESLSPEERCFDRFLLKHPEKNEPFRKAL